MIYHICLLFLFSLHRFAAYCGREMEEKHGLRWIWLGFAGQAFPLTDTDDTESCRSVNSPEIGVIHALFLLYTQKVRVETLTALSGSSQHPQSSCETSLTLSPSGRSGKASSVLSGSLNPVFLCEAANRGLNRLKSFCG